MSGRFCRAWWTFWFITSVVMAIETIVRFRHHSILDYVITFALLAGTTYCFLDSRKEKSR